MSQQLYRQPNLVRWVTVTVTTVALRLQSAQVLLHVSYLIYIYLLALKLISILWYRKKNE